MINEHLKETQAAHKIPITGRREATVPTTTRLPKSQYALMKRTARRERCKVSDLTRTAVNEWLARHVSAGEG